MTSSLLYLLYMKKQRDNIIHISIMITTLFMCTSPGIVVFSIVLGVATSVVGERGKPLLQLFVSFNDIIMCIIRGILWYSPIGICSLIASALLKIENLEVVLTSLALLVGTVITGCMIHQLIILPIILGVICRRNPYTYFLQLLSAYLTGMVSGSSAVAMPYILRDCPEKLQVNKRVTLFVTPICVTINGDGSALFITVATIFVAQSYSIPLGVGQLLLLVFLVNILISAAASVPSSSIVVLIMVSAAMNIPVSERIGLLMTVEWILDRIRTGTNVVGHSYGCAVIHNIAKRFIPEFQSPTEEEKDEMPPITEKSDMLANRPVCEDQIAV